MKNWGNHHPALALAMLSAFADCAGADCPASALSPCFNEKAILSRIGKPLYAFTLQFKPHRINLAWLNSQEPALLETSGRGKAQAVKSLTAIYGHDGREAEQIMQGRPLKGDGVGGSCAMEMCFINISTGK